MSFLDLSALCIKEEQREDYKNNIPGDYDIIIDGRRIKNLMNFYAFKDNNNYKVLIKNKDYCRINFGNSSATIEQDDILFNLALESKGKVKLEDFITTTLELNVEDIEFDGCTLDISDITFNKRSNLVLNGSIIYIDSHEEWLLKKLTLNNNSYLEILEENKNALDFKLIVDNSILMDNSNIDFTNGKFLIKSKDLIIQDSFFYLNNSASLITADSITIKDSSISFKDNSDYKKELRVRNGCQIESEKLEIEDSKVNIASSNIHIYNKQEDIKYSRIFISDSFILNKTDDITCNASIISTTNSESEINTKNISSNDSTFNIHNDLISHGRRRKEIAITAENMIFNNSTIDTKHPLINLSTNILSFNGETDAELNSSSLQIKLNNLIIRDKTKIDINNGDIDLKARTVLINENAQVHHPAEISFDKTTKVEKDNIPYNAYENLHLKKQKNHIYTGTRKRKKKPTKKDS